MLPEEYGTEEEIENGNAEAQIHIEEIEGYDLFGAFHTAAERTEEGDGSAGRLQQRVPAAGVNQTEKSVGSEIDGEEYCRNDDENVQHH